MKAKVEVWTSTHNRHEKHYFLKDGEQHAYQDGAYLFGLNPELVTREREEQILGLLQEDLKFDVPLDRRFNAVVLILVAFVIFSGALSWVWP